MDAFAGGVTPRSQRTIGRSVGLSGFGLFSGADVRVEILPAPEDHGIVFERIDLSRPVRIPATIEYVIPQPRHTVIGTAGVSVATIEHVMAALAGLHIDNCLIRIDGPEVPTLDGSSCDFVRVLDDAGIEMQSAPRPVLVVRDTLVVTDGPHVGIAAQSPQRGEYTVGYILDYGMGPIPAQSLCVEITPQSFVSEIAMARTFALEEEVRQLRAMGLGLRATAGDVVVFGDQGVIDNALRVPDECVRHKILDCIGDFALAGCDLCGRFTAKKSGHRLNQELIRRLLQSIPHGGADIVKHWNHPTASAAESTAGPVSGGVSRDVRPLSPQSPLYRRAVG